LCNATSSEKRFLLKQVAQFGMRSLRNRVARILFIGFGD